jgi:hypothetical protein
MKTYRRRLFPSLHPRAGLAAVVLAGFACLGPLGCSDGANHTDRLGAERLRSVPADGLVVSKQVFLAALADTIPNCDTASEYKLLVRSPSGGDAGGKFHYDEFTSNGYKIPLFTFQKFSGDSLFLSATLYNGGPDNFVSGVCIEQKYVARTFMLADQPHAEAKKDPQRGHRRKSGGMGL